MIMFLILIVQLLVLNDENILNDNNIDQMLNFSIFLYIYMEYQEYYVQEKNQMHLYVIMDILDRQTNLKEQ